MISCTLRGQLGNQMFQVAATMAHAIKNGTDYAFPGRSGKRDQFPFMFPHLPIQDFWNSEHDYYREERFGIYKPIPDSNNQQLQGYFQSEKYFWEHRDEIVNKAFSIIPHLDRKYDYVSLHIRRGDALKHQAKLPQPSDRYLLEALGYFDEGYKILVFSDDIEWCKQKFVNFTGHSYEFQPNLNPYSAIGTMASCEHHIIVNSTFSWWAAWLGEYRYNNTKVIAPHVDSWFGEKYKDRLSAQDIVPSRWIQIKY